MEIGQTVRLRSPPSGRYFVASKKERFRRLSNDSTWSGIISSIPTKLLNANSEYIDIVLQDGDEIVIKTSWIL